MFIINTKTVEQIESILLEGYTFKVINPHVLDGENDFDYDLRLETNVEELEEVAGLMRDIEKDFKFYCLFPDENSGYDLTIQIKVSKFLELTNENK